jgi:hypothetical protein
MVVVCYVNLELAFLPGVYVGSEPYQGYGDKVIERQESDARIPTTVVYCDLGRQCLRPASTQSRVRN